jgi:hypothetical protein
MRNTYPFPRLALPLGWLVVCMLLATQLVAQSGGARQAYTLQGRVVDERGQGLPGTTVLLGGTTLGTATNADGSYSLPVQVAPGTYTLTFSTIGYRAQNRSITLGATSTVSTDATLTEARQTLDDVVVIGSTISVSKRELGNAISTVTARELEQTGTGGALNALQGKLPGAQVVQNSGDPSGSVSVRLRTHSAGGITRRDFMLAAKIEEVVGWRPAEDRIAENRPG